MHRSEKGVDEVETAFFTAGEPELVSHAGKPMLLKAGGKRGDRLVRKFDRPLSVGIQERKQGLGEPGKIRLRNGRLITVGVAPELIDRAEGGRRIVRIHEGARSKINGLFRKRRVVGAHHAMDEADMHPKSWARESAQVDKWIFCLTTARLAEDQEIR